MSAARASTPANTSQVAAPLGIAQQAAHCRSLMRHLGIERAHVVGHSSSANMVLQLALDNPEVVQSLALLEPALLAIPSGPYGARAVERYRAGDRPALSTLTCGGCAGSSTGQRWSMRSGAFDQAVADADTFFFAQELPGLREWSFGSEEAGRATQPVLAVLGARSKEVTPVFDQRRELLLACLPKVERFVLRGRPTCCMCAEPARYG